MKTVYMGVRVLLPCGRTLDLGPRSRGPIRQSVVDPSIMENWASNATNDRVNITQGIVL